MKPSFKDACVSLNRKILSVSCLRNRVRLISGYRKGKSFLKGIPSILYIELTNKCNLECIMCPRSMMTRPQVDMDLKLFRSIVSQINSELTELIVLHSDGEPLLNENLFKLISIAKSKKLKVMTSTNATLLDSNKAKQLIDSGLDILTISIDGTTKEVYEAIRKGSDFDGVIGNVKRFLKQKGKSDPFVIMQMIEMKENRLQTGQFLNYWSEYRKYKVYPVVKPMTDWFNEHPEIIDPFSNCDRPWFGMVILSNGSIVPCVHDINGRYEIGHGKNGNIYDVWNSEKMVKLREGLLKNRRSNELCRNCNATSPNTHNIFSDLALIMFDMATIAKLLPIVGYNRPKQY